MSVEEFGNGYFYAADLKIFARSFGLAVGNFRKFELEELIRGFLRTGKVPDRKPVLPRKAGEACDVLKEDGTPIAVTSWRLEWTKSKSVDTLPVGL